MHTNLLLTVTCVLEHIPARKKFKYKVHSCFLIQLFYSIIHDYGVTGDLRETIFKAGV